MAHQWLRLWHDMPTDPKWRTIARASGQRIGDVLSVYVHLLVRASSNVDRGSLDGVSTEDLASALDLDTEQVDAIMVAMEGRVVAEAALKGWAARQPVREDGAEGGRGTGSADNYIYFVGTTDGYVVKVGVSRNPWARIKDMQTGSSGQLQLLATLKTPKRSEYEVHEYFKPTRQKGEWFGRSDALNSLIDKLKDKSIVDYDQCIEFLNSLPVEAFVANGSYVGTTKDKEEDKEETKKKNKKDSAPALVVSDLVAEGVSDETAAEYLAHRKTKRAKLTARAWSDIKAEILKAGMTTEQGCRKALARGWTGFEAAWLQNDRGPQASGETVYQRSMRERTEQITPRIAAKPPGTPSNVIEMEVPDVIAGCLGR